MDVGAPKARLLNPPFSSSAKELIVKHRNILDQAGWVYVPAADTRSICEAVDLTALKAAADSAPPDPYDRAGGRRRFYGTAELQPHSGTIRFHDPHFTKDGRAYSRYFQDLSVNADQGGQERRFACIPDYLEHDETFRKLARLAFDMLPAHLLDRRLTQCVGIHVVCLWSDGRQRAISSPPNLHNDGEPATAIIQLDRVNCAGGSAVNYVATWHCRGKQPQDCHPDDILARITMKHPLDMIIVDDARVSHYVSGVHGKEGQAGWRSSLLLDWSPLTPARTP